MKAKLYIDSRHVSLEFESEDDRDRFFANMNSTVSFGFCPGEAAELVRQRAISIDPAKMKMGWVWPVEFKG